MKVLFQHDTSLSITLFGGGASPISYKMSLLSTVVLFVSCAVFLEVAQITWRVHVTKVNTNRRAWATCGFLLHPMEAESNLLHFR